MPESTDPRSTADVYLELLAKRGVEYLFGNAGTDFGPIIDAYARRMENGEPTPKPITVIHEITGVAMAHGYSMVSGRVPAVMVHTIAGTANAIGGLINANRAQVPILFSAGRTPISEGQDLGARDMHIHWSQESFDQGSMVREWVKWDYELRPNSDLAGIVDRALAITQTEPKGPVYLTLPREVLAAPHSGEALDEQPRMGAGEVMAGSDSLAVAIDALANASNPLIITRSAGRDPAAVAALTGFAESLGAPVFDPYPTHTNINFTHPQRITSPPEKYLADADVIVVVECDVPWVPRRAQLNPSSTVIGIGTDPLHARYPVRGFRVDLNLPGRVSLNLDVLTQALAKRVSAEVVTQRVSRWSDLSQKNRENAHAMAESGQQSSILEKSWFSKCLNDILPSDAIVIDELGNDVRQLTLSETGNFYGVSQAGVLGWGLGAALGAKLAAPERLVVSVLGDGSYMFGVPTAGHWLSRRYNLPVLYIIWNNAKWGAVEGSTRMVYPEGWAATNDSFSFSDLGPCIDYELLCQAAGGYGERVEDPADLPAALERALKAVSEGRQALLNLVAHK
ncbi:MAG: thiamine pyrophosphate-requiring protein [Pseudomonadales bacterium]|nr:thiamine pyrophosphate-requiring protein [Pseudomonadales bacterium]